MAWLKQSWDAFYRQKLKGYKHIISIRAALILFTLMGALMVCVGAILLWASRQHASLEQRYDQFASDTGGNLTLQIVVKEDMNGPIYIYYRLDDYFQNHKRYARSVSWQQIHGDTGASLSDCEPQKRVDEGGATGDAVANISNDGTINPCGLAAWSFFNDSYSDFTVTGADGVPAALEVDSTQLVWDTDRDKLFGDYAPVNFNTFAGDRGGGQIEGNVSQDEHFMTWMRFSAKPSVQKFWGKLHRDLNKGEVLTVTIGNLYNNYGYNGAKSLILTTSSSFVRGNITFAVVWLIAGVVWLLALLFILSKGVQSGHFKKRTAEEKVAWLQSRLSWMPRR